MSTQSVSREDGPARGTTGKILPRMQVCLLGLGALAACSTTSSEPDVCFPDPVGVEQRRHGYTIDDEGKSVLPACFAGLPRCKSFEEAPAGAMLANRSLGTAIEACH